MERYYKTFVTVGNCKQSFVRLLNLIEENAALLPQPILIQRGYSSFSSTHCDVIDFVELDQFENYIDAAEIVISHGGAGTILYTLHGGKIPLVMPRREKWHEHINDHQVDLVNLLLKEKKIFSLEEKTVKEIIAEVKQFSCLPQPKKQAPIERIKAAVAELLNK